MSSQDSATDLSARGPLGHPVQRTPVAHGFLSDFPLQAEGPQRLLKAPTLLQKYCTCPELPSDFQQRPQAY